MTDDTRTGDSRPNRKGLIRNVALGLGGLAVGAVIATAAGAHAADTTTPSAAPPGAPGAPHGPGDDRGGRGMPGGSRDESKSQRTDEHLLTGDSAAKVRAAALAKYPGATIQRIETDSDGVYEAHLVTKDGNRVTAEVGKDFAVTGEEARGGPH